MKDLQITTQDDDKQENGDDDQNDQEDNKEQGEVTQVEIVHDKKLASFVTNAPGSKDKKNLNQDKELEKRDDENLDKNQNMPQMTEEQFDEDNKSDQSDTDKKDEIEPEEMQKEELRQDDSLNKREYRDIQLSDDDQSSQLDDQDDEQLNPEKKIKKNKDDPSEQKIDEQKRKPIKDMYEVDLTLYNEIMQEKQQLFENTNNVGNGDKWKKYESDLRDQAYTLSEELRSILLPTKIAGLKGDFKTGKRLNMRKVISFVASNYRKDKIWLRRSDPNQRDYMIMLAIDDTSSMSQQNVGPLALQALTVLALSLSKLEVGQIGVGSIRNGLTMVHDFDKTFVPADGSKLLKNFGFNFTDTYSSDLGLANFMRQSIDIFNKDFGKKKICFILSDGRFNKNNVRPMCQEAEELDILYIFIILDKSDSKDSILNYKTTNITKVDGKIKMDIQNYLEDFPYKNYIIVKDLKS